MTLLAERTYYDSEKPTLAWAKDKLFYGSEDSDAISLPPTLWDRLSVLRVR
ncbi:hypothetical protein J8I87_10945 [Paraburkholderia sp. LEh10]|uniref:hypothetical protein n=1 Tax=Paraburkholderia sp. LEh10 TaxID=2821353 RepID=UPI001AE5219F|nr:hypothetical protein [Paraburkholderia sp. LEh10]MBP0590222.1 hypothetical protein [Paraburkholderia sp. LEh10]